MLASIIMFLCRIQYRKTKKGGYPILFIKGTKEKYPRYLIYTEDEAIYKRMDEF